MASEIATTLRIEFTVSRGVLFQQVVRSKTDQIHLVTHSHRTMKKERKKTEKKKLQIKHKNGATFFC